MNVKIGDNEYNVPDDLKYNKAHQWAKVEGDNVIVGITDFAQKTLKEIIFVEFLQDVGDTTEAGIGKKPPTDPFGTVESTKGVSEVFSVVNGEIVEKNEALEDDPEAINGDCYGEGWMIKVSPTDKDSDLGNALDAKGYSDFIKSI